MPPHLTYFDITQFYNKISSAAVGIAALFVVSALFGCFTPKFGRLGVIIRCGAVFWLTLSKIVGVDEKVVYYVMVDYHRCRGDGSVAVVRCRYIGYRK